MPRMDTDANRNWCYWLIAVSLVLLTIGIGYDALTGTKLADFLVIVAGLLIGWIAFIFCFAHATLWRE